MPSGKIHNNLWKNNFRWILFISIIIYIVLEFSLSYIHPYSCIKLHCFSNSFLISIGVLPGYIIGKWITPDLDLFGITTTEWEAVRKWKIFGLFFVIYWMPYGYIFKGRHRSFWTHSYLVSTIIRWIYCFWWVLSFHFLLILFGMTFLGILVGMMISDSIHIWADRNY